MNDGYCEIYKRENIAPPGEMPMEGLVFKEKFLFEERSIGVARSHFAMQRDSKIDRLIRVWEDRLIEANDICKVDDGDGFFDYNITKIRHIRDENNQKVSDLTLERLGD